MSADEHGFQAEWRRIQIEQAENALFTDHDLPFASPSQSLASESSVSGEEPVVYNCTSGGATGDVAVAADLWAGLHTVAGLDIGYRSDGTTPHGEHTQDKAFACMAVLSFPDMKLLYTTSKVVDLTGRPYVPGFLSFREDALAELVLELLAEPAGRAVPQVLFVDGNGRLHPRRAGSAVAIGVKTGLPTVGVAKEYFPVHTQPDSAADSPVKSPCPHLATRQSLRLATRALLNRRGNWIGLRDAASPSTPPDSIDEYLGAALRSSPHAAGSNPVYVSCGHRVGLANALALVLACCTEARVPEPVRQADLIGRAEVRQIWG